MLAALVIAALVFLLADKTPGVPTATEQPFGFVGEPSSGTPKSLPLSLSDGSVVSVGDFTKNNQPEWASETSGFWVAGHEREDFLILYFPPDHAGGMGEFLVTLNAEPLGAVRRSAEAALKAKLEMTNEELCKALVSVAAAPGVNSAYFGYELRLSFCPGAVQLP